MTDRKRLQQLAGKISRPEFSALEQLDHLTSIIETAEVLRAEQVARARAAEASWSEIGNAIGRTKQAAYLRYGQTERPAVAEDPAQLTIESRGSD